MKITTEEFDNKIRFSISNFEEKYQKVFKSCFYNELNGIYYKDFSAKLLYISN